MPVITQNSTATPMTFLGSAVQYGGIIHQYGTYASVPYIPHIIANLPDEKDDILGSQVVGLVPVFSCESKECRSGKYGSDDANFMLPVFAQNQISISGDYYNDTNSFLFNLPSDTVLTHHKFYLDKKIDGTWVQQTELKDNSYGIYYGLGELCDSLAYLGYNIYWNLVLHTFGEGVYRFRINGSFTCSVIPSQGYLKFNDTFTESITATFSVDTLGHLCDAYYFDHSLTHSQLMQDYTNAINAYQNATYPTPLFVATWNAGLGRIDISSPLGENGVITDNGTFYPNGYLKQDLTGGVTSICDPINCYASPPFCLKTWSCYGVDLTTRFDASYTGGVIGDVNKSNAGNLFSFCCTGKPLMNVYKQSEIKIFYWKVAGEVTTFHSNEIWTFTANYGYDICSPIPITSGWTMPQALMFVVTSINTYQATLSSVEFTASYVNDIVAPKTESIWQSGIEKKDRILSINGTKIDTVPALTKFIHLSKTDDGKVDKSQITKTYTELKKLNPVLLKDETVPKYVAVKLPKTQFEAPVRLDYKVLKGMKKYVDNNTTLTTAQKKLRDKLKGKTYVVSDGTITINDIAIALSDNSRPVNLTVERNGKKIDLKPILANTKGLIGIKLEGREILIPTKTPKAVLVAGSQ